MASRTPIKPWRDSRRATGVATCDGLETMPDAEGSVELRVKIGLNGEGTSVTASGGARLGSAIVSCLVNRTSEAHFDAPKAASGTVVIPITFALQR